MQQPFCTGLLIRTSFPVPDPLTPPYWLWDNYLGQLHQSYLSEYHTFKLPCGLLGSMTIYKAFAVEIAIANATLMLEI